MKPIGDENLILIGMPGAGKSTVGRHLAQTLALAFLDTDQLMEERCSCTLQQIIDSEGLESFRLKEEKTILSLEVSKHVISTGGSVIYYQRAMAHLRNLGWILWLDLPLEELERRLANGMENRGLVRTPDQSLVDLYLERRPLYERYAQVRVDALGKTDQQVVQEILKCLHLKGSTHDH
ncbi:MAG: AAA family ATPase [Proteobacteria bacterium]|nr:AAA family ATPase [Pseudomonadota bacterium]